MQGDKINIIVDNTGNPSVVEYCYNKLDFNGRLILVGVPRHDNKISINTLSMNLGKKIIASHGGGCKPEKDINRYLDLIESKRVDMESIVTETIDLSCINEAIANIKSGTIAGRVMIDFDG